MRPTFLGFETARKALMAAQKGLDITGNNIANAETKGYTRQRVDQYSIYPPCSGYRYSVGNKSTAGQGVGITGIGQIRDPFLDNHFRMEYQEYGKLDTMTNGLKNIENIFDEITSKNLTANMDEMYAQLQKLSTDADRPEYANILLSKSKDIAFIFNTFSKDLDTNRDKNKFELDTNVQKVNDITSKIAEINKLIKDEYITISAGGSSALGARGINEHYGPNELLDDRNLLLDELASLVNIKTVTNQDGSVDVDMGGLMLVKGDEAGKLEVSPEPGAVVDKDTVFGIKFSGRNNKNELQFDKDILDAKDKNLTSGAIMGYMQILTGKGSYATNGENASFNGIPYYKGIIDSFAQTFGKAFNDANSYSENTAPTNVGGVDITIRSQLGAGSTTPATSVSFIATAIPGDAGAKWNKGKLEITLDSAKKYTQKDINDMIQKATVDEDSKGVAAKGFNVFFKDPTKNTISLTATAPDITMKNVEKPLFSDIGNAGTFAVNKNWVADPLGYLNASKDVGTGTRDNSNILNMISLFDKELSYDIPGKNVSEYKGTFKEYTKYYTAKLGQDTSFYAGITKNKGEVASAVEGQRLGVSSVSLNDEGTNMMTYQNALNAASRFMTTLDEALSTIINNMGLVGK